MRLLRAMIILIILALAGGGAFVWSGKYNVAANEPHWEITHWVLEQVRERSVANYSKGISVPVLDDRKLKETGFHEFDEMCVRCHGAPGLPRDGFAMGLYPSPPDLGSGHAFEEMGPAGVFWVIKNGLKMTGMPAFGATHEEEELWGVVAFLEGLHRMSPQEYKGMVQASPKSHDESHHHQ